MAPAPADCRAVVPEDGRSQALFTEPLPTVLGWQTTAVRPIFNSLVRAALRLHELGVPLEAVQGALLQRVAGHDEREAVRTLRSIWR